MSAEHAPQSFEAEPLVSGYVVVPREVAKVFAEPESTDDVMFQPVPVMEEDGKPRIQQSVLNACAYEIFRDRMNYSKIPDEDVPPKIRAYGMEIAADEVMHTLEKGGMVLEYRAVDTQPDIQGAIQEITKKAA